MICNVPLWRNDKKQTSRSNIQQPECRIQFIFILRCWAVFSFVWFKMRKWTRKKTFKKRDKPTPWQTIHDLGLFVVSNANATMFWYWTVCGRILQVRLNFPRDDRGTKDKGEEDWGRSGIGKVFPAGIGKKPNPWDHYGRANGAREQIYLFAESAN